MLLPKSPLPNPLHLPAHWPWPLESNFRSLDAVKRSYGQSWPFAFAGPGRESPLLLPREGRTTAATNSATGSAAAFKPPSRGRVCVVCHPKNGLCGHQRGKGQKVGINFGLELSLSLVHRSTTPSAPLSSQHGKKKTQRRRANFACNFMPDPVSLSLQRFCSMGTILFLPLYVAGK